MPRKKLVYPQHPNSIQDINRKFIRDYFSDGIEKKTITAEKAAEWANVVAAAVKKAADDKKEPMTAFADYRRTFCDWFYPELRVNQKSDKDFFAALAEKVAPKVEKTTPEAEPEAEETTPKAEPKAEETKE